jgi:hypothetical protein
LLSRKKNSLFKFKQTEENMNRLAGIIIAAIGLLVAVLSVLKILPALTSTGVLLILLGGLIIGLSFISKPDSEDAPRMSAFETLTGIFYAPTEVFRNLRRHPRWLAAVLIMSVVSTIYFNAFLYRLTPERVANFAIDKTLEMPMMNSEEARKQVEAGRAAAIEANKNPLLLAGQAVNGLTGQVFLYAFLAAVFLLFTLAMGGKINYWQAFSAAVYAAFPVTVIRSVLNTIILFIKDPVEIHPILGQSSLLQDSLNFLVSSSERPVLYTLLGAFSLFAFYWIWMNVTGLKNTGENVSPTIAWSATLGIFLIGVLLSVLAALLFPGFIS